MNENDKQAEPVAWRCRVNNTHTLFSEVELPSDAYDEGSLVPLYTAPPAHPVQPADALEPRYWLHNFGDEDGGEEFKGMLNEPAPLVRLTDEETAQLICMDYRMEDEFNRAFELCTRIMDAMIKKNGGSE